MRWLVGGAWSYGALLSVWVGSRWIVSHGQINDPGWLMLLPLQAAAAFAALQVLRCRSLDGPRRLGWLLLVAAPVIDMMALLDWNYLFAYNPQPLGTSADILYFVNYALLAGACAAFFVSCGGSLLNPRIWLDGATLALGLLAGLTPFFVSPLFALDTAVSGGVPAAVTYGIGIVAVGTMASLLFMQITDWRRERAMIGVLMAVGISLLTDVGNVAANIRGHFLLANVDDLCSAWSYAFFVTAALVERDVAPADGAAKSGNVYSFLPVFAILVSLSLVLGAETSSIGVNRWTAAIVVLGGAGLLLVRQLGVRHELAKLNSALAAREAEMRLTELLRASVDTIVVVGADGRVGYASPTSEALLGCSPESLQGRMASTLLGAGNEVTFSAQLAELRATHSEALLYEADMRIDAGGVRTVQVIGRNELANSRIGGLVLTLRNVTEQRSTERAVIEVATQERRQFSRAVHEELGQELAGISFAVMSLVGSRANDVAGIKASLTTVAAELGRTITGLRLLAQELSPLAVAHDSLVAALRTLAADVERRRSVSVSVAASGGATGGIGAGEHLYFVARVAVERAAARAGCSSIDVLLSYDGPDAVLSISDDAPCAASDDRGGDDWPLRMMHHRARLLGGTLRVHQAGEGIRIELRVPPYGVDGIRSWPADDARRRQQE
jgi:PAS domain S-box-containing protein